jgi:tetratricopeptide (TPR) repeat protein
MYFEKFLATGANEPRAIVRLGVAYLRVGRDEDGFGTLRRLVEPGSPLRSESGEMPDDRGLLEIASFLLSATRVFDDAIYVGERLLALDPANAVYRNNLAMVYADANRDPDRAYELAEEASRSEPDNPGHLDTLGWTLVRLGRYDDAEKTLMDAVRLSRELPPEASSEIYYHLGVLYRLTGRHDEADAMARRALENPPSPVLQREMEDLLRSRPDELR